MRTVLSSPWFRWTAGFLSILYMSGLYWLSDQPGVHAVPPFPGADKVVHCLLYLGLGTLLQVAFKKRAIVLFLGVTYGVLDEIHQLYVPGRSCDPWDMVADGVGILLGLLITERILSA